VRRGWQPALARARAASAWSGSADLGFVCAFLGPRELTMERAARSTILKKIRLNLVDRAMLHGGNANCSTA